MPMRALAAAVRRLVSRIRKHYSADVPILVRMGLRASRHGAGHRSGPWREDRCAAAHGRTRGVVQPEWIIELYHERGADELVFRALKMTRATFQQLRLEKFWMRSADPPRFAWVT
ncbi:hypothetical protein BH23GEM6_BH23GEM6_24280 [soil metagenome]